MWFGQLKLSANNGGAVFGFFDILHNGALHQLKVMVVKMMVMVVTVMIGSGGFDNMLVSTVLNTFRYLILCASLLCHLIPK